MTEAVLLQDPAETLDYQIDWTAWLNGDTITTSSWTVAPSGPTLSNTGFNTTGTYIYMAGVAFGAIYALENTIVSANGRTALRGLTVRGFKE